MSWSFENLALGHQVGHGEDIGTRVETDHRGVDPLAALRVLPLGIADINRIRLCDVRVGAHLVEAGAREEAGFGLIGVAVRRHQQIEPHMVVDQQAALRHRDKKPELDEDQQDRDKDAADRQHGAPLLIGQYSPGDSERHEMATLKMLQDRGYSA